MKASAAAPYAGGGVVRRRKATGLSRLVVNFRVSRQAWRRGLEPTAMWSRLSEQAIIITNAVFVFITAKQSTRRDPMRQTFDRRSALGLAVGSAAGSGVRIIRQADLRCGHCIQGGAGRQKRNVPPTTSSGTGTASVTYDFSTKMVTWKGDFSGLSGPATAAHIHGPAEAGKNAGVIVPLSQKDVPFTSPFTGSATLADDKAAVLEVDPLVRTGLRERPHRSEPRRRTARPTRAKLKTALARCVVTSRDFVSPAGPAYHGPAGIILSAGRPYAQGAYS